MKYHPIQLNRNINYKEAPPPNWLKDKVVCYWEIKTNEKEINYPIIPDGCLDLVINCTNNNQSFISPSVISPATFILGKNEAWFGVRFYPGVFTPFLRINIAALHFKTIELEDISTSLNKDIKQALINTSSFMDRVSNINSFLYNIGLLNDSNNNNKQIIPVLNTIYETKGSIVLKDYKNKIFGISERHLRRLFHKEIGIAPKRFARIVRTQVYLKELKRNQKSKSYYDAYFDQAHLNKEIKAMTGFTPKQIASNNE